MLAAGPQRGARFQKGETAVLPKQTASAQPSFTSTQPPATKTDKTPLMQPAVRPANHGHAVNLLGWPGGPTGEIPLASSSREAESSPHRGCAGGFHPRLRALPGDGCCRKQSYEYLLGISQVFGL